MVAQNKPQLVFSGLFDEREEAECQARGYRSHVWAELPTGERYALTFYDAVRLAQDLEVETAAGNPYIAEPGLIVLDQVTRENMEGAIHRMAEGGFFESMRPEREIEKAVRG